MPDSTRQPRPQAGGELRVPALDPDVDTLTAALAYAKAGWYVGPIRANDSKHAGNVLGTGWPAKTSRDPKTIIAWFAGSNLGVFLHVGRSGAWCADVDSPDHIHPVLRAAIRTARPPWQSSRPDEPRRGHYLFRQPPGRTLGNGRGALGKQWGEARGRNGIIVAFPTARPDGRRYQWSRTGPVPAMPDELAAALPDSGPAADAVDDEALSAFLTSHTRRGRPGLLRVVQQRFVDEVAAGGSRHEAAVATACWAMRDAAKGYYPALEAATTLRGLFVQAMANPGSPGDRRLDETQARVEYRGIIAWAIGQVDPAALAPPREATAARAAGRTAATPRRRPPPAAKDQGQSRPGTASIETRPAYQRLIAEGRATRAASPGLGVELGP